VNYFPEIQNSLSGVAANLAGVIWMVLVVAILVFATISAVLVYHWVKYSLSAHKMVFVMFAYFIVGGLLIAVAAGAAGYYQIVI